MRSIAVALSLLFVLLASVTAQVNFQLTKAERLQKFNDWLALTHIDERNPDIEVRETPDMGWGLFAKNDIAGGSKFLNVSLGFIMNWRTAQYTPISKELLEHPQLLDHEMVLILHVMYERYNPKSIWTPYLNMLPESFDSPIHWSPEELSLLAGTSLEKPVQDDLDKLKEGFTQILKKMMKWYPEKFTKNIFNKKDFLYANAVVWSRGFPVTAVQHKAISLIPLFDSINFKKGSNVSGSYDEVSQSFTLTTKTPISAGEQIFLSPGSMSYGDLLLNHGFLLEDAIKTVRIPLVFNEKVNFFDERVAVLKEKGFRKEDAVEIFISDSINVDLLTYFRVEKMKITEFRTPDLRKPLSNDTELKVYQSVLALLQKKLSGFPTSYTEDETLLASGTLTKRQTLAVKVRMAEKEVLQHNVQLAQAEIARLDQLSKAKSEL